MMVDPYSVRVVGPLAACAEGFCAAMAGLGYTPRMVRDQAYVLADLSRWLAAEGLPAAELTEEAAQRFLVARKLASKRRWLSFLRGYNNDAGKTPWFPHCSAQGIPAKRTVIGYPVSMAEGSQGLVRQPIRSTVSSWPDVAIANRWFD